ncbi:hypothetical protein BKA65DRAFT_494862 [Rhexocercosporidium sp. MPI-PUGE-AT-0058]|nr:hypothetical protein BKA65DRAFT_494862 [Rhexocercosporidium sp. MPI-PUGE-AT-0058]
MHACLHFLVLLLLLSCYLAYHHLVGVLGQHTASAQASEGGGEKQKWKWICRIGGEEASNQASKQSEWQYASHMQDVIWKTQRQLID